MNGPALAAFALAAIASAGDLTSILRRDRRLEFATKPAVMVLLIVAALLLRPTSQGERALFVVALVLGLAGDVFLMVPDRFLIPGIAAFLLGHLGYVVGFRFAGFNVAGLIIGLTIAAVTAGLLLRRILGALEQEGVHYVLLPPLDPGNLRLAVELMDLALKLSRFSRPPGVRRFHSVEEADADRQAWEQAETRRLRAPGHALS